MTVTSATARNDYTSTGGTEFAYTFRVLDEDHLKVYVDGALQTKTTDYTVDGVGDSVGGTVTFLSAVTSGLVVSILRNVPITQEVDYVEHDNFPAETHEDALDKLTMIVQQQQDSLRRTMQFTTASTSLDGVLPEPEVGKTLEWLSTVPPTLRNVTPAVTGISTPISTLNGGFGQDVSTKTGPTIFRGGTAYWNTGTVLVDSFGAVGDGATDDSAAIQAAIDSDIPHLVFNPVKNYYVASPVVVDALTDNVALVYGRTVDGQGCLITCGGGVANAFQVTNQRHLTFENFRFGGTCTGAFVYFETATSWYNDFFNLRAISAASATALLHLHNTSGASQPGMFRLVNLVSSLPATILFSMAGGAAPQFDDFIINHIIGGSVEDGSAAIILSTGCVLTDSTVEDIFSGGQHAIYASGAYIQKSQIRRVRLEIPPKASYPGSDKATNYGFYGQLDDCTVENIHIYIPNTTDNSGACCVKAVANDSKIRNLSILATDVVTIPYAGAPGNPYPALDIVQGNNVTFDFPQEYIDNGVTHGSVGACTNITYLGGVMEKGENATASIDPWYLRGGIINNYGQGAVAAVVTLPAAGPGMSVRFTMVGDGGAAYSVKAAATDKIILDGTALDNGDKITCAAPALGNTVYLYTARSGADPGVEWYYDWVAVTEGGTWTDGGA